MNILAGLAFIAGACIAVQAAMNAQLGQVMNNSLLATSYAFFTSFLLVAVITLYLGINPYISEEQTTFTLLVNERFNQVPWYLWLSCFFSVIGVASLYFLIPKMGVGSVMTFALIGQIIVAMLISHFGLFNSPIKTLSFYKMIGTLFLVAGIILINRE